MMRQLNRALVSSIEIAYESHGDGEPVVLIHAGIFVDWNTPLLEESTLTTRYRLVSYHRPGCGASSHVPGSLSIADEAALLRSLLRDLGIARAHVVGHSNGGMVALQLALDAPEMVHTIALLESARPAVPDTPQEAKFAATVFLPAVQQFQSGHLEAAVDLWMRGVAGPHYRAVLDDTLPGSLDRSMADAATFFAQQLSAVRAWSFTPDDASTIIQPVLVVVGERSTEVTSTFGPRHQLLLDWLPNAEACVLSGATHLLHVENPRGMAEELAAFFTRHSLSAAA